MKEFEITISEEEKENFLDTEDFLLQLKAELESKVEARQEIIGSLAESLQLNIKTIFEEVESVRVEIMKPELIDVSCHDKCKSLQLIVFLLLGEFSKR